MQHPSIQVKILRSSTSCSLRPNTTPRKYDVATNRISVERSPPPYVAAAASEVMVMTPMKAVAGFNFR